tara:strand:+ start:8681 stop:9103 length:423 start_codon:yes stop_codon:yes gene_type:complete
MRVPVNLLTCSDMKGHQLLRTYGPLADDEVSLYFDLLRMAFDRWFEAVGYIGPGVYTNYLQNCELVEAIENLFDEVLEEDDPMEAWKVRKNLRMGLDALDVIVANMAQVFHAPRSLHEFYYNLASRLRATYDYIIGGDAQ